MWWLKPRYTLCRRAMGLYGFPLLCLWQSLTQCYNRELFYRVIVRESQVVKGQLDCKTWNGIRIWEEDKLGWGEIFRHFIQNGETEVIN